MPELQLETGAYYRDNQGRIIHITEERNLSYPYKSDEGLTYKANGWFSTNGESDSNLIKRVNPDGSPWSRGAAPTDRPLLNRVERAQRKAVRLEALKEADRRCYPRWDHAVT